VLFGGGERPVLLLTVHHLVVDARSMAVAVFRYRLWDVDRREIVAVLAGHESATWAVSWSPDGNGSSPLPATGRPASGTPTEVKR